MPVNGELSLVLFADERPDTVIAVETDSERIRAIYVQRNPDKLKRVAR